jgi:hypothetical protein
LMHNAPHNPYLQALAVLCTVLTPLRTLGACSVFAVSIIVIYTQDVVLDVGAVAWKLRRIGQP